VAEDEELDGVGLRDRRPGGALLLRPVCRDLRPVSGQKPLEVLLDGIEPAGLVLLPDFLELRLRPHALYCSPSSSATFAFRVMIASIVPFGLVMITLTPGPRPALRLEPCTTTPIVVASLWYRGPCVASYSLIATRSPSRSWSSAISFIASGDD